MPTRLDLTGEVFGRLSVIRRAPKAAGRTRWWCRCECGRMTTVATHLLSDGRTQSCGCLRSETARLRRLTHGAAYTPEYKIWAGLNLRCYTPTGTAYPNYGGRGITVCDAWRHDFPAFLRDMGPRPSRRHSIDRIDNDGPYSPENCRWATDSEQAANKRNNRPLTLNGRTQPISAWAREIGMNPSSLRERLESGMTTTAALTTAKRRNSPIARGDISMSPKEWAAHLGIPWSTLRQRLRLLPLEVALDPSKIDRPRQIAHDGVTLTVRQWATRLGVTYSTLRESLTLHPIEVALAPRRRR